MTPTDRLTTTEVADLIGVKAQTIRVYRVRGAIPEPDGIEGRSPWWLRSTIDKWLDERPKRGRPPKAES